MTGPLADLLHACVLGAAAVLVARWCLLVAREDGVTGALLAAGVLARVSLGVAAFWVSSANWAPLAHLHTGDGFWAIAPDARYYFRESADAARTGWFAVDRGGPSPTYVWLLSVWMRVAGITPHAVAVLNALLAAGACRLVVSVLQPRRSPDARLAARILVAMLSCSPSLIVFSALGLKDQFTLFLLTVLCVGVLQWLDALTARRAFGRPALAGAAMTIAAVALLAGVRAYAVVLWLLALATGTLVAVSIAQRQRVMAAAQGMALLVLLWLAFMVGAGPYYQTYGRMAGQALGRVLPAPLEAFLERRLFPPGRRRAAAPVDPEKALDAARKGFVQAAGATSLYGSGSLNGLARRTALIFLPVLPLRAAGVVEISGGRGLFGVADLDSIVNLASLAAVFWLAVRLRGSGRHTAYLVYAVTLAGVLALPMAYAVTNFGTLFRLRLMPLAVLWLVLLAFSPTTPSPRPEARPH